MTLTPHYRDDNVTLYAGDCLDVLAELPDASVDSVVTDPPYGLDFMGKKWDTGAVAFDTAIWGHCLRVLKPGGHVLAFGGTRTWHRLAVAIEDAGFEIRDNIAWLYGSGFPKSLDVSKAIDKAAGAERKVVGTRAKSGLGDRAVGHDRGDLIWSGEITSPVGVTDDAKRWQGWGTALKPAFEPVVVGRKPLSGTVAANVLAHGVGALNIDATRVATNDSLTGGRPEGTSNEIYSKGLGASSGRSDALAGRWPSNVVVDEVAAQEIDRQSGITRSASTQGVQRYGRSAGIMGNVGKLRDGRPEGHDDEGGASRFFPAFKYQAKAPTEERPTANGIAHPTVKPVDLMRWLIRLVTPPGGTVLEPFAGSGTTAEAAIHEHMKCIAIEREADYLPLIVARLTKPIEIGFDFGEGA